MLFRKGLFPGAVCGAAVGLAPGVLLVLILSGGNYHVGGGELLGFIAMSVIGTAVAGAILAGTIRVVSGLVLYGLRSRQRHP